MIRVTHIQGEHREGCNFENVVKINSNFLNCWFGALRDVSCYILYNMKSISKLKEEKLQDHDHIHQLNLESVGTKVKITKKNVP